MVKVETEAPALWRKPSETATPSTLDKCAFHRLYSFRACLPPAGCDTLAWRTKPLPPTAGMI